MLDKQLVKNRIEWLGNDSAWLEKDIAGMEQRGVLSSSIQPLKNELNILLAKIEVLEWVLVNMD
jgi:hypothetical protein